MDVKLEDQLLFVDFFQDFLVYLKYLDRQPITQTARGNISRKDIEVFSQEMKSVKKTAEQYSEHGWKIVGDWQLRDLDRIRLLAGVMYLTYKRKGHICLSKNGRGYISSADRLAQFRDMVLHYWERFNWEYFEHSQEYNNSLTVLELIQKNQNIIWKGLLENGEEWIEFGHFAKEIEIRFQLQKYFAPREWSQGKPDYSIVENGLIRHNLELFGLVETARKPKWKNYLELERFKPTALGLYLFKEELERPLYSGVRSITDLWKNWPQ